MRLALSCVLTLVCVLFPLRSAAQLRPLEPVDWPLLELRSGTRVSLGAGILLDQRAALAGVRGDLIELGEARVTIRSGRFLVELAGTPQRFLRNEAAVEEPYAGSRPMAESRARHDAGDYRIGTTVALSDVDDGSFETLRFGTRLPTTDNKVGLDRDQTDFFALLGMQRKWSRVRLAAEAGVGINGTRRPEYEQSDALTYDLTVSYDAARLTPSLVFLGQNDLRSERTRGNEDLAEVRAQVRWGGKRWLQAGVLAGLAEFSPSWGIMFSAGAHLGGAR